MDHNFENTADTLVQEASKMGLYNSEYKLRNYMDPYAHLILCYNTGNYLTFFQVRNLISTNFWMKYIYIFILYN